MTTLPPSTPSTFERLSESLALIAAAQQLQRGQLSTQAFAEQVHQIGQQHPDATDALTHMAMACAQVLREAADSSPETALSRIGMALAVMQPPRPDGRAHTRHT